MADFVVSLGLDGRIHSQGTVEDALSRDPLLFKEVNALDDLFTKAEDVVDSSDDAEALMDTRKGQLVAEEEVIQGRIRWEDSKSSLVGMSHGSANRLTRPYSQILLWFLWRRRILVYVPGRPCHHARTEDRSILVFGLLGQAIRRSPAVRSACRPISRLVRRADRIDHDRLFSRNSLLELRCCQRSTKSP